MTSHPKRVLQCSTLRKASVAVTARGIKAKQAAEQNMLDEAAIAITAVQHEVRLGARMRAHGLANDQLRVSPRPRSSGVSPQHELSVSGSSVLTRNEISPSQEACSMRPANKPHAASAKVSCSNKDNRAHWHNELLISFSLSCYAAA